MPILTLEPLDGLREHGEPFEIVNRYKVKGLPEGHGAWVQNLDYPRELWSIQRFRDGAPHGDATGSFMRAEHALAALQEEYE